MRKDDHDDGTYFRSRDRVFCMNGEWFFQTRENDHGPYRSRDEAEIELARYAKEMNYLDSMAKPPGHAPAASSAQSGDLKNPDQAIVD